MSPYDTYTSPLATRNASPEMLRLWSARHKFNTWRRIWLAVAEAMCEMGEGAAAGDVAGGAPAGQRGRGASPGTGARDATTAGGRAGDSRPAGGRAQARARASSCEGERAGGASRALVTREQVEELRAVVERKNPDGTVGITDEEIRLAEKYERELRHDVMAHVHALGDACPKARAIIHLGMTSQDVVCNADLITIVRSLHLLRSKVARLVVALGDAGRRHKRRACLGFTHYQPAQPTTVGRRVAGWASDLFYSFHVLFTQSLRIPLRGLRGATGTQASFLAILDGDGERVDDLESNFLEQLVSPLGFDTLGDLPPVDWWLGEGHQRKRIADEWPEEPDAEENDEERQEERQEEWEEEWEEGTLRPCDDIPGMRPDTFVLTGQTYPRVIDALIVGQLGSVAAVLHKIATDIRLLSNRKELDEPFEDKQIGSSAMPYKRNPMRCERICGLTRFVMNLVGNAYDTAATQWLERTLDDSSNRRLSLPEAFLALDGALDLMHNVASGLIVHEAMVRKNLMAELPFMATENILMACVRAGGDRQQYHELIRVHAQASGMRVKQEGLENDLLDRLKADEAFWSKARGGPLEHELDWSEGPGGLLDPTRYVGRSVEQTERFIREVVEPLRERYKDAIEGLGQSGPRV